MQKIEFNIPKQYLLAARVQEINAGLPPVKVLLTELVRDLIFYSSVFLPIS